MHARKRLIIILLSLLVLIGGTAAGVRYLVNRQVADRQRLVVTTVAIAQIFDKLDINLVGVPTTAQTLPTRYQHTAKVGGAMNPSVEKIAALNPSKVYAVSTLKDEYSSAFKAQSVPVTYLKLDTVAQLKTTLRQLGHEYYRTRPDQKDQRGHPSRQSPPSRRETKSPGLNGDAGRRVFDCDRSLLRW